MDKPEYELNVSRVCDSLKNHQTKKVHQLIADLMKYDMDAAEPHNLLGIYYEILGDEGAARKHYRAAYALDPTYTPACRNLNRICSWKWCNERPTYDFGDSIMEQV